MQLAALHARLARCHCFLSLKKQVLFQNRCWMGWGCTGNGVPGLPYGFLTAHLSREPAFVLRQTTFLTRRCPWFRARPVLGSGAGTMRASSPYQRPRSGSSGFSTCVCTILCALCPGPAESGMSPAPVGTSVELSAPCPSPFVFNFKVNVLQGSWMQDRSYIQLYCYLRCNKAV